MKSPQEDFYNGTFLKKIFVDSPPCGREKCFYSKNGSVEECNFENVRMCEYTHKFGSSEYKTKNFERVNDEWGKLNSLEKFKGVVINLREETKIEKMRRMAKITRSYNREF